MQLLLMDVFELLRLILQWQTYEQKKLFHNIIPWNIIWGMFNYFIQSLE